MSIDEETDHVDILEIYIITGVSSGKSFKSHYLQIWVIKSLFILTDLLKYNGSCLSEWSWQDLCLHASWELQLTAVAQIETWVFLIYIRLLNLH